MKTEPKTPSGEQPIMSLRIPPDMLASIDELARRSNTTRSVLVRMALKQGLHQVKKAVEVLNQPA